MGAEGTVFVCGPNNNRVAADGKTVGRLLVHRSIGRSDMWAVSHAVTGGKIVNAADFPTALRLAERFERDHGAALDLLDCLDWGQNIPRNMASTPAMQALRDARLTPLPAAADTSPIVSCTSDQAFAAGPSLGDMS